MNDAHLARFEPVLAHLDGPVACRFPLVSGCLGRKGGRFWAPQWSGSPSAEAGPRPLGGVNEATGPVSMPQQQGPAPVYGGRFAWFKGGSWVPAGVGAGRGLAD